MEHILQIDRCGRTDYIFNSKQFQYVKFNLKTDFERSKVPNNDPSSHRVRFLEQFSKELCIFPSSRFLLQVSVLDFFFFPLPNTPTSLDRIKITIGRGCLFRARKKGTTIVGRASIRQRAQYFTWLSIDQKPSRRASPRFASYLSRRENAVSSVFLEDRCPSRSWRGLRGRPDPHAEFRGLVSLRGATIDRWPRECDASVDRGTRAKESNL